MKAVVDPCRAEVSGHTAHLSDVSIVGSWFDAHMDSSIEEVLYDFVFTGCDSLDLQLSGDGELFLKLYIYVSVSIARDEHIYGNIQCTLCIVHQPGRNGHGSL